MSIAEKLTTIAENEQKVYEAGVKSEYDRFWDEFQNYGNRTEYTYAFAYGGWNDETYNPKYAMRPTSCNNMFMSNTKVTDTKVIIDLTNPKGNQKFALFSGATKLKTIKKIIVSETNVFQASSPMFNKCNSLEHITFDGVIGKDINFQYSPLSIASMKNIIEHLKNYKGTDQELTCTLIFNDACWTALEADSSAPDGGTWKDYIELTLGWITA